MFLFSKKKYVFHQLPPKCTNLALIIINDGFSESEGIGRFYDAGVIRASRLPNAKICCKINTKKCYILSLSQKIVFFNEIFATCAILTLQIRIIGVLCSAFPMPSYILLCACAVSRKLFCPFPLHAMQVSIILSMSIASEIIVPLVGKE